MSRARSAAEKLLDDVASLRASIVELRAERAELIRSPTTKPEALARVDAYLDSLAAEARVSVESFMSREVAMARDLIQPSPVRSQDGFGVVTFDPVLRFLAWVNRDALRAALVGEIAARYATHAEGVDDETLAARLAAIDAELLELETREERAISSLEASGVRTVLRRADAVPRALVAACS